MRSSALRGAVAGIALVLVALLTGCGSGRSVAASSRTATVGAAPAATASGRATATATGTAGATAGSGPAASGPGAADTSPVAAPSRPVTATPTVALSPAALVARVTLADGDLGPGTRAVLVQDGAEVAGQVTLDNCGYAFTTERHRVARRQVIFYGGGGRRIGSNEVVVYDSVVEAARALAEFRSSVTGCPTNAYRGSAVEDTPPMRYVGVLTGDRTLPIADNAIDTATLIARGTGQRLYEMLIFQRQGRVLDGIYLQASTPLTPSASAGLRQLALYSGKRLLGIS